ncbi:MAG: amidohydrolase [Candidatus Marinimicrobia bacterium]|nr:amidohydrolase [Candidatus Neomarinimicrobiota bacterium]MCF7850224.1 amidohydrolase [Candidatus Neomarinimicrobiota bacterium]MCF7903734.1 amidohydrolase [Candidatus Neomarinimicrobiota bacterium]
MRINFADKLLTNARVLTQDPELPEANQVAIQGQRILAVGNDLSALTGESTEVIDLNGAVVAPGFIDAHLHLLWGGQGLLSIPIQNARSKADFIRIVKEHVVTRATEEWVEGNGWNENLLKEQMLPHRSWLDEAAPDHATILIRHDGHSAVVSSKALQRAGIDRETADPVGGVIDRDDHGEPTGILRDAALELVLKHIPQHSEEKLEQYFQAAQAYLLSKGVTAICDMIHDLAHFYFLQKQAKAGKLKIRITAYAPVLKWQEIKELISEGIYEDEWFQFKGVKGFCDGSLGSHTALMLEPYEDTPGSSGIYDSDWEDTDLIERIVTEADSLGLQTVIHAIGDRAIREVLDIFESVFSKNGERDRRYRIEHAQHVHPHDQDRFRKLGVIASMQPAHCLDDSLYADKLLGDRCKYAYPFRSLQAKGATLVLGSDWPVSPADPLLSIQAALHRNKWIPEEAMTLTEALAGHTSAAAFSIFRDDIGVLRSGTLADLVILQPEVLNMERMKTLPDNLIQGGYSNGDKLSEHVS